jgi:hypothetical protein
VHEYDEIRRGMWTCPVSFNTTSSSILVKNGEETGRKTRR